MSRTLQGRLARDPPYGRDSRRGDAPVRASPSALRAAGDASGTRSERGARNGGGATRPGFSTSSFSARPGYSMSFVKIFRNTSRAWSSFAFASYSSPT